MRVEPFLLPILTTLIVFFQLAVPVTIIYLLYKIYRNTQKTK